MLRWNKNCEGFQNDKSLARKSQLSDILIELIKLGFSAYRGLLKKNLILLSDILIELIKLGFSAYRGLLKKKDLNLIKNFKSEKEIFKLFLNNNY